MSTMMFHLEAFRSCPPCNRMPGMALESHRHLRSWRKHRDLTQDQVVDRLAVHQDAKLPKSKAQLSKIENGKSPYSQRLLEALAEIYECEPWELLRREPGVEDEADEAFVKFRHLGDRDKDRARAYISGLADAKEAG